MPDPALPASPLHALCVYAEPLVGGRRVVVFGDSTRRIGERFLEMGARVVHVYDPQPTRAATHEGRAARGLTVFPLPSSGDFDVRDGAFDLAVVVDIAELPAPAPLLARIRRLLAPGGAVLVRSRSVDAASRGRGRANANANQGSLDYYELYDLVAMQFAHVRMVGQIPWSGVALAELGRDGGEPDVTVDTQLVTEADAPEAFLALGSQEDVHLAEYALVQVPAAPSADVETTIAYGSERADLAAAQLRASLLEAQIEELRSQRNRESVAHADAVGSVEAELAQRLAQLQRAEGRAFEASARAEQAVAEARAKDEEIARQRDRTALGLRELEDERRARTRSEQELVVIRQHLEAAGRDTNALSEAAVRVPLLEDALARLEASMEEQTQRLFASEDTRARLEVALATALVELDGIRRSRAQGDEQTGRAALVAGRIAELEAVLVALEAEAAELTEGYGRELSALEEALRERARSAHVLEQELGRRERIILDLVHALEEARAHGASDSSATDVPGQNDPDAAVAVRDARRRASEARAECDELRQKLDAAALEIARREAENTTSAWRIQELEQGVARLEDEQSELTLTIPPPAFLEVEREANDTTLLTRRLSAVEDELDMLRQALAQEHEARVRAESGEALSQARAELARQAALLEKLSRELEAHDGIRRPVEGGPDETVVSTV